MSFQFKLLLLWNEKTGFFNDKFNIQSLIYYKIYFQKIIVTKYSDVFVILIIQEVNVRPIYKNELFIRIINL